MQEKQQRESVIEVVVVAIIIVYGALLMYYSHIYIRGWIQSLEKNSYTSVTVVSFGFDTNVEYLYGMIIVLE